MTGRFRAGSAEDGRMRTITVNNNVSLDGVMQAPMSPDEDTRGGFPYGGWALAGNDEALAAEMGVGTDRAARCCSATAPTTTWRRTGRTRPTATRSPST